MGVSGNEMGVSDGHAWRVMIDNERFDAGATGGFIHCRPDNDKSFRFFHGHEPAGAKDFRAV